MKLFDIMSNHVVPKEKQKSKVYWELPKMKKTYPPFSKGAFSKLIDVTGGDQIEDPAGGKVLKRDNTMKKQTLTGKGDKIK